MQLSPNKEIFSEFFAPFPESKENLEYFEKKKISLGGYLFLKL